MRFGIKQITRECYYGLGMHVVKYGYQTLANTDLITLYYYPHITTQVSTHLK